jgi:hypothetical protein
MGPPTPARKSRTQLISPSFSISALQNPGISPEGQADAAFP